MAKLTIHPLGRPLPPHHPFATPTIIPGPKQADAVKRYQAPAPSPNLPILDEK